MATGVLVLGVNRATRLLGHLTLTDKRYTATVRLGATTVTDDADGDLVATRPTGGLTEQAVLDAFGSHVGEIEQVPSAVSAVKVDGRRAYARVRGGEEVVLPARPVTVHAIEVTALRLPAVEIEVHCSSGTYVRALARDVGESLGVGGHLTALRRTAVGPFGLGQAHTLERLAEGIVLLSMADAARASFPALDLDDEQASAVRVGRPLAVEVDAMTAVFAPDGEFLALYRPGDDEDRAARPVAVFAT
jgi:tRNA pseudouridine55 synthase